MTNEDSLVVGMICRPIRFVALRVARCTALLSIVLLALGAFETRASAQDAAHVAQARNFFEAGLKLYKQQLYQEALAQFLESNRILPREATQRNIGQTYRDLKDNAAAYEAFETLLAKYGDKMKPQAKGDAQQALQELAVITGTVTVTIQEPNANVTADGKDVGQTPLVKPIRLNFGRHTLTVAKAGFETITQSVDLQPGSNQSSIAGPLSTEVVTGHVNVSAQPADPTAKVFVDGRELGAPPWQGELEPGQHTFQVKSDTMASELRPVDVAKKGTYDVSLELHAQQGRVAVSVNVADAQIAIDGQIAGRGVYDQALPIGKHLLSVSREGFVTYTKDLVVGDGERVVENVTLQAAAVGQQAKTEWSGVYEQFNFFALFETGKPSNDVAQGIGYTSDTSIQGSGTAGGGVGLRVGYSFGWVGAEGQITCAYDHSADQVNVQSPQGSAQHPAVDRTVVYPAGYVENYDLHRIGTNITLGGRLMPKTQNIRPTIGFGAGIALKSIWFNRGVKTNPPNTNADNTVSSGLTTYVVPAISLDAGIELGSTPGSRFYLALQMFVDFAGAVPASAPPSPPGSANYPTQQINLVNGNDVFIGPSLGVQFGE
jgi:tetratricopeptide (TPR) repeat protein